MKKSTTEKPVVKKLKINPALIGEVIRGEWGDEKERNAKLKAAGYTPSAVTKKINDLKAIAEVIKPHIESVGDYYACLLKLLEK